MSWVSSTTLQNNDTGLYGMFKNLLVSVCFRLTSLFMYNVILFFIEICKG